MEGLKLAQERPRKDSLGDERLHDLHVQLASGTLFLLLAHTCISMHMLPLEYKTPLAGSCREDLVASLWALNLEVSDLINGLIP